MRGENKIESRRAKIGPNKAHYLEKDGRGNPT